MELTTKIEKTLNAQWALDANHRIEGESWDEFQARESRLIEAKRRALAACSPAEVRHFHKLRALDTLISGDAGLDIEIGDGWDTRGEVYVYTH